MGHVTEQDIRLRIEQVADEQKGRYNTTAITGDLIAKWPITGDDPTMTLDDLDPIAFWGTFAKHAVVTEPITVDQAIAALTTMRDETPNYDPEHTYYRISVTNSPNGLPVVELASTPTAFVEWSQDKEYRDSDVDAFPPPPHD